MNAGPLSFLNTCWAWREAISEHHYEPLFKRYESALSPPPIYRRTLEAVRRAGVLHEYLIICPKVDVPIFGLCCAECDVNFCAIEQFPLQDREDITGLALKRIPDQYLQATSQLLDNVSDAWPNAETLYLIQNAQAIWGTDGKTNSVHGVSKTWALLKARMDTDLADCLTRFRAWKSGFGRSSRLTYIVFVVITSVRYGKGAYDGILAGLRDTGTDQDVVIG